jgi:formylmethanofuran--tetrahydromethanopterin N-formyltransferase
MQYRGVEIEDTFAEAFPMMAARVVVTAANAQWAHTAAQVATGYGTSVIACDAEAGIEQALGPDQTPDHRPGYSFLLFGFSSKPLGKALIGRIGQCVMTCPTTSCYDGLAQSEEKVKVGADLRYFGDRHQVSKKLQGRRYWRIPVMDGEFVCEDAFGICNGVAGGNFLILGQSQSAALEAAEAAVAAIQKEPQVICPFPGGVVRSGSKVGSAYKKLRASTNDAYCPTLRGVVESQLPDAVHAVYEIVIDGLNLDAVRRATRRGVQAACREGIIRISAGNYGGKLGKYHIRLHEVMEDSDGATERRRE